MLKLAQFIFFSFQLNFLLAEKPSVIIVGAGSSGIAAASKLLENSINNVTILEAENRIGGRVNTVEFADGVVDLGAEYCHGQEGNIVYELVKDLNVLEQQQPFIPANIRIYDSQGQKVAANLSDDLLNSDFESAVKSSAALTNKSIGEVYLTIYNETILKKYENDDKNYKVAIDALKLMENNILSYEGGFSWFDVAAKQHYEACPGDSHMTWKKEGYKTILKVLTKEFPNPVNKLPIDDKLHLNKKVTKIIWNSNQVQVQLSDNTSLEADFVILTPSINVMKSQKNTLFEPKLPSEKIEALEAIGLRGVMKVFLHFSEKWWNDKIENFEFLWLREDLEKVKNEFTEGPKINGFPWVTQIASLIRIPSNKNVFGAWIVGDVITELEEISEDILLKGCNYVIRKFLGKSYNTVDADKLVRSQWITNPNFLGTWAYEKAGYSYDILYHENLGKPLKNKNGKPVLLFAGTDTHQTKYSTVHGAIESGQREASRILNYIKSKN